MRRALRAGLIAMVAALLLAGAAFAWLKLAPRRVPAGQPPLRALSVEALPELRQAFNAGAGSVRVLALLSPT